MVGLVRLLLALRHVHLLCSSGNAPWEPGWALLGVWVILSHTGTPRASGASSPGLLIPSPSFSTPPLPSYRPARSGLQHRQCLACLLPRGHHREEGPYGLGWDWEGGWVDAHPG